MRRQTMIAAVELHREAMAWVRAAPSRRETIIAPFERAGFAAHSVTGIGNCRPPIAPYI
jgi:hypothetical protein